MATGMTEENAQRGAESVAGQGMARHDSDAAVILRSEMSSILNLPEMRDQAVRWSVEDYEQFGEMLAEHGVLPKRTELIRGIIIKKMPKSPRHIDLSKRLYDAFLRLLPVDFTIFQEGPLRLEDSESEPDVMLVRGRARADWGDGHPTTALLVIEVAVSSVAMDREYAALYAEAGVNEYWIVIAETQQIEVRRQPSGGTYAELLTYRRGDKLACETVPEIQVSLDALFAG